MHTLINVLSNIQYNLLPNLDEMEAISKVSRFFKISISINLRCRTFTIFLLTAFYLPPSRQSF